MLRDRTAFQRKKSNVSKAKAVNTTKCKKGSKELSSPSTVSETTTSPSTASAISFLSSPPEVERSPPSVNAVRVLSPSVPSSLYLPLESTVTSLFFNSYLHQPRDPLIGLGFMELLPDRYFNARPGTPLYLGTLAVSLFSVSAWTGNRSFLRLAEHTFVRALSNTRVALQGNLGENMVETIMAVLLLSVYEVSLDRFKSYPMLRINDDVRSFLLLKSTELQQKRICEGQLLWSTAATCHKVRTPIRK